MSIFKFKHLITLFFTLIFFWSAAAAQIKEDHLNTKIDLVYKIKSGPIAYQIKDYGTHVDSLYYATLLFGERIYHLDIYERYTGDFIMRFYLDLLPSQPGFEAVKNTSDEKFFEYRSEGSIYQVNIKETIGTDNQKSLKIYTAIYDTNIFDWSFSGWTNFKRTN